MTHREELAGRLEKAADQIGLFDQAVWVGEKATQHAAMLAEAAAALRRSPTAEELETLAVARLIEFANDVEGNTRARRMVLACERAKSLAQAIAALYGRGG